MRTVSSFREGSVTSVACPFPLWEATLWIGILSSTESSDCNFSVFSEFTEKAVRLHV